MTSHGPLTQLPSQPGVLLPSSFSLLSVSPAVASIEMALSFFWIVCASILFHLEGFRLIYKARQLVGQVPLTFYSTFTCGCGGGMVA